VSTPRFILALIAAAVLVPAAPASASTTRTSTPPAELSAYYDSGQWGKDISKVVKRAKTNLHKDLAAKPRKPAIVLDIDETALFNAPCLEAVNWDLSGLATCAVTGAGIPTPVLSLYRDARRHRVTVAFITGRPEALQAVTDQNLNSAGYAAGYLIFLRPADDTQDTVVPFKSLARATLEGRGFHILANVGDQASDLAGGHAKRRYKLPNPVYLTT
jgi:HAD superfamily, subfamily IIIB (Acid phosphatase)